MERLIVVALAAAGLFAAIDARAEDPARWSVQIDNDVVFHTDRWYTSGVRIARTQPLGDNRFLELGILQEAYTPDPYRVAPGTIDRPYVGRLLFTAARHDFLPGLYRTLEIDAGVRGPSALGRQSTEAVHHVIPAPDFDWSRQLPDEFDFQAVAVQTHELSPFGTDRARLALHYGAVLGNQVTFAHAGVELRMGAAPSIAAQPLRFAATPPLSPAGAQGWSGFFGASGRWVARNELLSMNANAIGPPLEREHGVLRLAGGVAWSGSWGAVTFSLVQDSREFVTQHSPHRFGVLGLRLDFL